MRDIADLIERHREDERVLVPDNEVMELCDLLEQAHSEIATLRQQRAEARERIEDWMRRLDDCFEPTAPAIPIASDLSKECPHILNEMRAIIAALSNSEGGK